MYFLLKMVIFHCHVSLPEGKLESRSFRKLWLGPAAMLPKKVGSFYLFLLASSH